MVKSGQIVILFIVLQTFLRSADSKHAEISRKESHVQLSTLSPSEQIDALERVFKALEGLVDFYKREYKNLNVDGVFGLRVLEGAAKKIISADQKGEVLLPSRLKKRVKKLQSRSTKIAKMSILYIKKENPHYFEVMGFTAVEAWENIKPLRILTFDKDVPQFLLNNSDDEIQMIESEQDHCFRGLVGDKKKRLQPCTISESCWKTNTAQGKKGYYLTHQLLYFLLGQVKGCSKVFETKLKSDSFKGGVDRFLSQRCQLMYPEMLEQENKARETNYLEEIDLYMEQGVVCGMMGYAQFFSLYRLNLILGWIHPSRGCFGFFDKVKSLPDEEEVDKKSDENKKTMRQLKVAKDLKGGCEVHSSAVGTGILSLYLRWLLHISNFPTPEINLNNYDEAGFFVKHQYLGVIPSVKSTIMFVVIVILILIVFAKRMLRFRVTKSIWM